MTDSNAFAKKIARLAVPEMIQHGVPPTPENYAVWYLYASGRKKALVNEIDAIKMSNDEFSVEVNQKLYDTYANSDHSAREEIKRHSYTAQSLIGDLMQLISVMTDETTDYTQKLDGYIDELEGKYQDENIKDMVKELVERTSTMRDSGKDLDAKLAESTREVQMLRNNLERITDEANRDPLTGLANRKAFDEHMQTFTEEADAKGDEGYFSLVMMDIDFFKKFNDKYGHQVGDEVLKIVAHELQHSVKGRDVVARYGGEEFAVLLPNTPLSGALIVAENLRKNVASKELKRRDTKETYGTVTLSIGAAEYHGKSKDCIGDLIRRADEALYKSKKGGRNRVTQESAPQ